MDRRGVSPVIATVLLIAITVLAVAAIATYIKTVKPGELAPISDLEAKLVDNGENDWWELANYGGDAVNLADVAIIFRDLDTGTRGDLTFENLRKKALEKDGYNLYPILSAPKYYDLLRPDQFRFYKGHSVRVQFIHMPSKETFFDKTIVVVAA